MSSELSQRVKKRHLDADNFAMANNAVITKVVQLVLMASQLTADN
jgi:hypothetical protein